MSAKGAYTDEFEKALYALKSKGDVTEPVLTEFGYHLIKLLDIKEKEIPDFDSQRDRIKNLLIAAEARNIFQERLSELEDIIYESPDLADAANLLGKKVRTSEPFSRKRGMGIAADASIRESAYSDNVLVDKENSALIEVEDGQVVVLRANTYKPSVIKELDQVRGQIIVTLSEKMAAEQLAVKRDELIQLLASGETEKSVAEKAGTSWQVREQMKRQQEGIPREVLAEAFKMPKPKDGSKSISSVSKAGGDEVIIILSKVQDGFSELSAEELNRDKNRLTRMNSASVYMQHLNFLKEKAKIKFKKESSEAES